MKKIGYWIIVIILNCIIIELISYNGLYFLKNYWGESYKPANRLSKRHGVILSKILKDEYKYMQFDAVLGWSIKENGSSKLYQANSAGMRASKEYELAPSANILRIATFGDSFTHCAGVGNDSTWQHFLEKLDKRLEVMNFGVDGYGLDQAYLRYLNDGVQYNPDIVFIGFMTENIYRNVNTFRPFCYESTDMPLTKPRFTVKDQRLSLLPNPIAKIDDYKILLSQPKKTLTALGKNDFFYSRSYSSSAFDFSPTFRLIKILIKRLTFDGGIIVDGYYNKKSEAFNVTKKIIDEFHLRAASKNSIPIILVFPNWKDVVRFQSKKTKRYQPLLLYLSSQGYKYIDLMDVFAKTDGDYKIRKLFGIHYSAFSNELVANYIYSYLRNDTYSSLERNVKK